MTFPTTPVTLNFNGADKAEYGIRDSDATKRIAQLDTAIASLNKDLSRAQEMMNAHKTVLDGTFNVHAALDAEATHLGFVASRGLNSWAYIYNAGDLRESEFFPWSVGGGQFTGNPNLHAAITYALIAPPSAPAGQPDAPPPAPAPTNERFYYFSIIAAATTTETGAEGGSSTTTVNEPITTDLRWIRGALEHHDALPTALRDTTYRIATQATLNSWGDGTSAQLTVAQLQARIAQIETRLPSLNSAMATILGEYNQMVPVLLRIAEGSCVKVQSILKSIAQIEGDKAHALLLKDLSDKSGATATATKAPALWGGGEATVPDINPDDL